MTETLSFPGLGLEIALNPTAIQITNTFGIYWYGIIFAVAFLAGSAYLVFRSNEFGLDKDRVTDVLFGSAIGGIIGARAYYVIFDFSTYQNNLIDIFNVRKGGLAFYGALIGGVIVCIILCRFRKVKLLPMLDLAAAPFLLGQAIGRWGNFVNIEAFGSNTTAPWGMTSPSIVSYLSYMQPKLAAIGVVVDPQMPVHPTFFYESIWCLVGFIAILLYTKHRRFDGELGLLYCIWYGLGRFLIEGLRTDSLMIGTIRVSQLLSLLGFIAAVLIFVVVRSKIKRAGDPQYLMLYKSTDDGKAIVAGTFYPKPLSKKEIAAEKESQKPLQEDADEETDAKEIAQTEVEDLEDVEEANSGEEEKKDGSDN